jgi:hypothetical protein
MVDPEDRFAFIFALLTSQPFSGPLSVLIALPPRQGENANRFSLVSISVHNQARNRDFLQPFSGAGAVEFFDQVMVSRAHHKRRLFAYSPEILFDHCRLGIGADGRGQFHEVAGDDNEVIGPGMGGQPVILFQAVMDVGDDENFPGGVGKG